MSAPPLPGTSAVPLGTLNYSSTIEIPLKYGTKLGTPRHHKPSWVADPFYFSGILVVFQWY